MWWLLVSAVNDPTKKSTAASSITSNSANCSLMTHLTPATLIVPSKSTAETAKPRAAQVLSVPTRFAMDSPKPNTLSAQPTAWNKLFPLEIWYCKVHHTNQPHFSWQKLIWLDCGMYQGKLIQHLLFQIPFKLEYLWNFFFSNFLLKCFVIMIYPWSLWMTADIHNMGTNASK